MPIINISMKKRIKYLLFSILLISTVFLLSNCSVGDKDKEQDHDHDIPSAETAMEYGDQNMEVETYEANGVVKSIPPNRKLIFVVHGEIEGFMHKMEMPLKVIDTTLLSGIHPKDSVRIKFEFDGTVTTLKEIERILSH